MQPIVVPGLHRAYGGKARHLRGWHPPSLENLSAARKHHFAMGYGVTPQSKGFKILPSVCFYEDATKIEDQESIGSCTANAWTSHIEMTRRQSGLATIELSRLFFYGGERAKIMGVPLTEDSGASITDGALFFIKYGCCSESMWPYEISKWDEEPPRPCWDEAAQHHGVRLYSLSTLDWIKACLSLRRGVVHGFQVPEHFMTETAETGQLHMPAPGEPFVGGHAVLRIGYDDAHDNGDGTKGAFLNVNSWGRGFGLKDMPGTFWEPYGYVEKWLSLDPWTAHIAT